MAQRCPRDSRVMGEGNVAARCLEAALELFAPYLCDGPPGHACHCLHRDPETIRVKLFARLRQACQLEAVLDSLLPLAPPMFQLPPLIATRDALGSGPAALVVGCSTRPLS